MIPHKVRQLVYRRDGECCLRCGKHVHGGSIHHRRPRGMGGTSNPAINDPRNLVLLCGSGTTGCHGWVESNRTEALLQGWLITGLEEDELRQPLLGRWGWMVLTRTGKPLGPFRYRSDAPS